MFSILILIPFIVENFKVVAIECTEKGRFANFNDLTCQSYYLCSPLKSGKFSKLGYYCRKGTYFNPNLKNCQSSYICTYNKISSNVGDLTNNPNRNYFECTEKGKFANFNDLTCKSYYLCSPLKSGKFSKFTYYCRKGTYFDPNLKDCQSSYICTSNSTTSTSSTQILNSNASVIANIATDTIKTSSSETSLTTSPEVQIDNTTVTLTNTTQPCIYINKTNDFECTEEGRFPSLDDSKCKKYFVCTLNQYGTYQKIQYVCDKKTYFNPNEGCDFSYKCPYCSETTF